MKQKGLPVRQAGLAPILIVLLIAVVLGIGGYVLYNQQAKPTPPPQQSFDNTQGKPTQPSPTPSDETVYTEQSRSANPDSIGANWKIYTNSKFSFKYPKDWYFMTAQENYGADYKGAKTEILFSNKLKNGKIPSGIDVTRSTASGMITISGCNYASGCEIWTTESNFYDIKSGLWQGGGGPYPTKRQVSLSELGGKRAVLIESQADTDAEVYKGEYGIQYNVFLGDEHLTLTFGYNNQNQDNNQVLEKFNQILSTFKFLP